ncbi:TIP41-like protein [Rhopilema esculentum]|uniref:TIP41-like protein n=1 Tax=Rhopilema esculentum TaxID=499914 RepID=UPI0031CFEAB6
MEKKMATTVKPLSNDYSFGPWTIHTVKGTIMKSNDIESVAAELDIPQLPEMLFVENKMEILHQSGFGLSFNATDALKRVDNKQDLMKVAVAEEWQRLRADTDGIKEVVKPFDWTFTTDYRGTIVSKDPSSYKVHETTEIIDLNKLKIKEQIYFYEDVILFEDELADNGMASLNIKIRVMAGAFFALLRFFLRVDNVLVRINDTRLYHETGTNFLLREYSSKEQKFSKLKNPFGNPSDLAEHLEYKKELVEKIEFFDSTNLATNSSTEDG